jgi:hypothetical protein
MQRQMEFSRKPGRLRAWVRHRLATRFCRTLGKEESCPLCHHLYLLFLPFVLCCQLEVQSALNSF